MLVMDLSWMQDVAILERHSGNEERICYIRTVLRFGWKKTRLLDAINLKCGCILLPTNRYFLVMLKKEMSQERECIE